MHLGLCNSYIPLRDYGLHFRKTCPAEDAYSDFDVFGIYRRNSPFQGWNGLREGRINDTEVGLLTLRNFAAVRLHQ